MKTVEQLEIEVTRLKAALVTINDQVSELARHSKAELSDFDHKEVYLSIKNVSGKALRGKT